MGAGFASLAGAFCSFGPAIFLPICLWNLWITRYVPRPPAQAVGCECGKGQVYDARPHAGSPLWGRPGAEPAKSGNFQSENTKGARGRPSISVGSGLALLVERRVDLGDLLGLERVAPRAVAIPVPVLGEAEAQDAEVGAVAV